MDIASLKRIPSSIPEAGQTADNAINTLHDFGVIERK
jgi:hypothetical protein